MTKRTALAAAALISAALAGAPPAQAGGTDPLYRLRDGVGSDLIFRVDPLTLQPLGRPIRTFKGAYDIAFSPGGRRLAYSDGDSRRPRIQIVDLKRWRSRGVIPVGGLGSLNVGWAGPRTLVAIGGTGGGANRILWIDPARKRVLERRAYQGLMLEALAVPGGYALALAPESGIGPLRLLIAAADGSARSIELEGIVAGFHDGERRGRNLKPALTVDPVGGRLYAIAARGDLAAEVDLASGEVTHHALGAAAAKGNVDMWLRYATWAGDGRIVVSGERFPWTRRGRRPPEPFGASVIDTGDWSVATLDPRPNVAVVAWDAVLAHGVGTGLLGFDPDGRRRFTRFPGKRVATLGGVDHLAYVWVWGDRDLHVIDVRDGRTVREMDLPGAKRIPFLLTPPA